MGSGLAFCLHLSPAEQFLTFQLCKGHPFKMKNAEEISASGVASVGRTSGRGTSGDSAVALAATGRRAADGLASAAAGKAMQAVALSSPNFQP
jgi:hypothetical protein